MRTYSGHSTPEASNTLYRQNLAKGQTGLSVAFDLPTQTGYDSDHPLAKGEVGKVGVPVGHLGDMRALFAEIPLEQMNTSMTINATALWLFALYVALAQERGVPVAKLSGTTQNDIVKEYLARGTFIFPPRHSMRLTCDLITFAVDQVPQWNPINICSYHLQEAGATPVQELAYAIAIAIAVLDAVRERFAGTDPAGLASAIAQVVGRLSFFVNAGVRFVEEMCKMRAFVRLWDRVARERYGVTDEKQRLFRYGVQVNSLGLTAAQPENNVVRIVLEMLAVTLSKNARARAIQLPAWNEALGLPRPIDQQWSLRAQQILAYETDLLDYDDLFDGSPVVLARVSELASSAWREVEQVIAMGGALAAVETGYIKERLVVSNGERLARIESGAQVVVGVNKFIETEPSPLLQGDGPPGAGDILTVNPEVEGQARDRLRAWRAGRDPARATAALDALRHAAREGHNLMPSSIEAARAGVTTGEWAGALREIFGEYRAPTGIAHATSAAAAKQGGPVDVERVRQEVRALGGELGRPLKILVGKPGLDGHSNGAEQIALRARDCGFEVVYEGIRVTPSQIVASALQEGVHLVGLSILSGSHREIVPAIVEALRAGGGAHVPVVVGGIIPPEDERALLAAGVAQVFTPKDFDLTHIMHDLVGLIRRAAHEGGASPRA